jgi:hypothetical protein
MVTCILMIIEVLHASCMLILPCLHDISNCLLSCPSFFAVVNLKVWGVQKRCAVLIRFASEV